MDPAQSCKTDEYQIFCTQLKIKIPKGMFVRRIFYGKMKMVSEGEWFPAFCGNTIHGFHFLQFRNFLWKADSVQQGRKTLSAVSYNSSKCISMQKCFAKLIQIVKIEISKFDFKIKSLWKLNAQNCRSQT